MKIALFWLFRLGKWLIDGGMRLGTPEEDHDHVFTVYRGVDSWKTARVKVAWRQLSSRVPAFCESD